MKFSEYLSSVITTQYTLLEQLKLIEKFLEQSQLEISIVNLDTSVSGKINPKQVEELRQANFVFVDNAMYTLNARFNYVNGKYNELSFYRVNSIYDGDIYTLYIDLNSLTFVIEGGMG